MTPSPDHRQSLENLKLERDAIALYDALARIERSPDRAAAFARIAGNERRHAEVWATRLREAGLDVPPPGSPRLRVRIIVLLARLFGTHAVSDLVKALEGDEEAVYGEQESHPEIDAIAADEREHAEIWKQLDAKRGGGRTRGRTTMAEGRMRAEHATPGGDGRGRQDAEPGGESWHRAGQSGTLRAVIFGISDGLVSNAALVMGVAGAAAGDPKFILLAGIAGLLAGAFSMAAGEYVSMQSQRELFERQIHLEREELMAMPEEEEAELARIYERKGFTEDEARTIAHRLFEDPDHALDTLVREELGLDPNELGDPWRAAGGSFVAFAIGAIIPVVPFLFGGGVTIISISIALSLVSMFIVGSAVSLLTGRSFLYSGFRQVGIGAAAAIVTYAVGSVIGVGVS